ncbi:hypothetical protein AVEN_197503-1 [Araneus ventricosus]|uniref:Sushi domain-containing protein n=1 Tax=Araneus ventricosus TaxID=182803 RepID=A0A4Y2BT53_ARAVE|nr:hypothetical protein AVEN_197503-1 [Araneus ventricosus]
MPSTIDFFLGIVSSIALLTISAACSRFITCPCGTIVNSLYYKHCINDEFEENTCERWVNCQTCEANVRYCLTCPEGRSGPTCAEGADVYCPDPGYIPFGFRRLINGIASKSPGMYTIGQSFLYYCNQGYVLVGNNVSTCLTSGIWSSQRPSCSPISGIGVTSPGKRFV